MQSVIALPLIFPPVLEGAGPVSITDGAFKLSFAADARDAGGRIKADGTSPDGVLSASALPLMVPMMPLAALIAPVEEAQAGTCGAIPAPTPEPRPPAEGSVPELRRSSALLGGAVSAEVAGAAPAAAVKGIAGVDVVPASSDVDKTVRGAVQTWSEREGTKGLGWQTGVQPVDRAGPQDAPPPHGTVAPSSEGDAAPAFGQKSELSRASPQRAEAQAISLGPALLGHPAGAASGGTDFDSPRPGVETDGDTRPERAVMTAGPLRPSPQVQRVGQASVVEPVLSNTPAKMAEHRDRTPAVDQSAAASDHPADRAELRADRPVAPPGFWERMFAGLSGGAADPTLEETLSSRLDLSGSAGPSPPLILLTGPRDSGPTAPMAALAAFGDIMAKATAAPETKERAPDFAGFALGVAPGSASQAFSAPIVTQTPPAHLPVPQVAAQITAALSQAPDGATELALSPDELGHVRLRLERDAKHPDRMVVMITFERPETLDLFRRHAGDLAEALRSAGFAGANIGFGQKGDSSQHPGPGQGRAGSDFEPAMPDPATVIPAPRLMGGASLDLRL
jgi:hypothetical protein